MAGCSGQPSADELYDVAYQCQQSGGDCDEEWDDWNKAEEAMLDRQRRRDFGAQCKAFGDQYVLLCDGQTVDDCYREVISEHPERCRCQCVERGSIGWLFSN